jgi:hypothetical protein
MCMEGGSSPVSRRGTRKMYRRRRVGRHLRTSVSDPLSWMRIWYDSFSVHTLILYDYCLLWPRIVYRPFYTYSFLKRQSVMLSTALSVCVCYFCGSRPDGSQQEPDFVDRNTSLYL